MHDAPGPPRPLTPPRGALAVEFDDAPAGAAVAGAADADVDVADADVVVVGEAFGVADDPHETSATTAMAAKANREDLVISECIGVRNQVLLSLR